MTPIDKLGEKLGEGRTAEVFAWGDSHVLKLFYQDDGTAARNEAAITSTVAMAGAPTPSPHGLIDVDGRVGVILERLPGPLMGDRLFEIDPFELVADLAALHARIHGIEIDDLRQFEHTVLEKTRDLSTALRMAVAARMSELPSGSALLHGDLHPFNVMYSDDGWCAIDWVVASSGPPAADVARTDFLLRGARSPDGEIPEEIQRLRDPLADAYLAAYAATRPIDRDEVRAWRLPILADRLDENIPDEQADLLGWIAEEMG